MSVTTKEINSYAVSITSDGNPKKYAATITLFDGGGKTIALLRFFAEGTQMAPNEFSEELGYPMASYPSTALASVVDILRNEKPIYFAWHDYLPGRCYGAVRTSREPVGESE